MALKTASIGATAIATALATSAINRACRANPVKALPSPPIDSIRAPNPPVGTGAAAAGIAGFAPAATGAAVGAAAFGAVVGVTVLTPLIALLTACNIDV